MKTINVDSHENKNLSGFYPKFWFEEKGEKYLFKAPFDDFTDIGEVFASFLYGKLGLNDFVKYEFAKTKDGIEGTICKEYKPDNQLRTLSCWDILGENYVLSNSENFKDKNTAQLIQNDDDFADDLENSYYNGFYGQYENSVERIIYNIEQFCLAHELTFNKKEITNNLIELSIIDFFTANNDRHTNNILFEITKDKKLKLMPILDNGAIFGLHRRKDFILGGQKLNIFPRCGISESGTTNESLEKHTLFGNKKQILFDAFEYSKTHKDIENLLKKLTTLNMPQLIAEFELKEDIDIPREIKEYMQKSYSDRIAIFNDYKKQKSKLDKKLSKNMEK